MKICKRVALCLCVPILIFAYSGCMADETIPGNDTGSSNSSGDESGIVLQTYSGATVDLCMGTLREYLKLEDENEQAAFLYDNLYVGQDGQAPVFCWSDDGSQSYTVYFADNVQFEDAVAIVSQDEVLEDAGFFIPGKTYYWRVEGDSGLSLTDNFTTLDEPLRFIEAEGSHNIRDVGGWQTAAGEKVKYGMLYRGGQLNGYAGMSAMTENGKYIFNDVLDIKSELDLRTSGRDDAGQTSCWWNEQCNYEKIAFSQYSCIIPEYDGYDGINAGFVKESPSAIKKIFNFLSDESNYPIYFHCNSGADRTGTLTFLILGLLGVSYDDITRDFETTSFTYYGKRWRSNIVDGKFTPDGIMQADRDNFVSWGEMYSLFMEYYAEGDGTLAQAIENYLLNVCGVDYKDIISFKNIMLEQV